jgi:hypothetical protein
MPSNNTFLFRFSTTSPGDAQIKLVGGSIDENLCGKLEENNIRFKYINDNCWEGKASTTQDNPSWLYFYVMFSIGQYVDWQLQVFQLISNGAQNPVYSLTGNTGSGVHDAVEWKVKL